MHSIERFNNIGYNKKSNVKHSVFLSLLLVILIATAVFALGSNITGNSINIINGSGRDIVGEKSFENSTLNNSENISQGISSDHENSAMNRSQKNLGNESLNITLPEEQQNGSAVSQENETFNNASSVNESGNQTNGTAPENSSTATAELENVTPAIGNETNATLPAGNATNATVPNDSGNMTGNATGNESEMYNNTNVTGEGNNGTSINQTQPPGNETEKNVSGEVNGTLPSAPKPNLKLEIIAPKKIIRGETISLQAVVKNIGETDAKNVVIRWSLPDYFIADSDLFKGCGVVAAGGYCEHTIDLFVAKIASLGPNEIKASVEYE